MIKRFLTVILCAVLALTASTVFAQDSVHFRDVSTDTRTGQAIYAMVKEGYIQGASAELFEPESPISAADFISMIAKARGVSPAPTQFTGNAAGYMQAALNANWFQWDEIPPNDPANFDKPVTRELGANIVVAAFFGQVDYDYTTQSQKISDFSSITGRYYNGVLGGLQKGIFDHTNGTPFYPKNDLSRGDACLWVYNAAQEEHSSPSPSLKNRLQHLSPHPDADSWRCISKRLATSQRNDALQRKR